MKRYYNHTTHEWYTDGQSLTRKIDNGVFSGIPSVEQLESWGFEEYIEPTPTPEELLARAKAAKIAEIDAYDQSDAVNSFSIGGQSMWLTVAERQQIATQISANEAIGRYTMTRWFGGVEYTFTLSIWKQMLVALEVYAGDALNVTEAHKAAVSAMESVSEVEGYEIESGYPERLVF